jgi:ATP-dependent DNA helicase DinG
LGLTDRRGECIYAACPHFKRCFIEKSVRAGRKADVVIANHALVLHQAAIDHAIGVAKTDEENAAPGGLRRIVFDEGHHLFDAADSAFSGHLTGLEAAELRRWLRGPETERRRGLGERIGDLLADQEQAENLLQQVLRAANALPGPGWTRRIQSGHPEGAAESFLALLRQQVLARSEAAATNSLETDCLPLVDGLPTAIDALTDQLAQLQRPMSALANLLLKKLDDQASELQTAERGRIEAIARGLKRRGELMVGGWVSMLKQLQGDPNALFINWFEIEQAYGREHDVGFHSHWVDPSVPLANAVLRQADGIIVTSATLKDRPPDIPDDWSNAEARTGVIHLPYPVKRVSYESPFDYGNIARVIVVTDVNREDMDQIASAYRELFTASGGGALGLFTAIARLRAVHKRLAPALAKRGLSLYAQHIDPMDTGTLVDMFRAERDACLLGTDAVRDGVDVPGDSLRLIVLDRVPWGTPTILERARAEAFVGNAYKDMVVRLRLRQAFGRLIRQQSDRGVFVILDPRLATRFTTAFPPGVKLDRLGLVDAIEQVAQFNLKIN